MRPRMLSARPVVTRTSRHDPGGAALESVAAEFALLAQRRARTARQIDLLARQLSAAQDSLDAVQARMAMLAARIDGMDPSLRAAANLAPPPPPPPAARPPVPAPPAVQARARTPFTPPRVTMLPRGKRPPARRRPFSPE